ncbi:DUF5989 family protein [Parapedobacter defluvii]
MEFIKDILGYLRHRKKYWLASLIFILLLIGFLIVFAGNSVVAPFIYTLF